MVADNPRLTLPDPPGKGEYLTADGKFKSDKYAWCPEGFLALKFTDPEAWPAIMVYAKSCSDRDLSPDITRALDQGVLDWLGKQRASHRGPKS